MDYGFYHRYQYQMSLKYPHFQRPQQQLPIIQQKEQEKPLLPETPKDPRIKPMDPNLQALLPNSQGQFESFLSMIDSIDPPETILSQVDQYLETLPSTNDGVIIESLEQPLHDSIESSSSEPTTPSLESSFDEEIEEQFISCPIHVDSPKKKRSYGFISNSEVKLLFQQAQAFKRYRK